MSDTTPETPTAPGNYMDSMAFIHPETTTAGQDGDIRESPRSWQDDYARENGNYLHNCCICAQRFLGHKRRVQCRQCASKDAPKAAALHIVQLLPCPFCGDGDVEMAESSTPKIGGGNKAAVFCNSCFCEGPPCENEAVAREAWNSRSLAAQLAQAQGEVERKTVELDRLRNHGNQNRKIRVLCNESIVDGYIRLVDEQEAELTAALAKCERLTQRCTDLSDDVQHYADKREEAEAERDRLLAENAELVSALREIEKGEGKYSRCELEHAENVIERAVGIARSALAKHQQADS